VLHIAWCGIAIAPACLESVGTCLFDEMVMQRIETISTGHFSVNSFYLWGCTSEWAFSSECYQLPHSTMYNSVEASPKVLVNSCACSHRQWYAADLWSACALWYATVCVSSMGVFYLAPNCAVSALCRLCFSTWKCPIVSSVSCCSNVADCMFCIKFFLWTMFLRQRTSELTVITRNHE